MAFTLQLPIVEASVKPLAQTASPLLCREDGDCVEKSFMADPIIDAIMVSNQHDGHFRYFPESPSVLVSLINQVVVVFFH
jgi:hypothetical protein